MCCDEDDCVAFDGSEVFIPTLRGRGEGRGRTTNHDNGGQKVGKHRDHTDSTSTIEEESESSTRVSEVVCRGEMC